MTQYPEGLFDSIIGIDRLARPLTIKKGDVIRFVRPDGVIAKDTVRACFWVFILVAPYAPNHSVPAVVLTEHSWTLLSNIDTVLGNRLR